MKLATIAATLIREAQQPSAPSVRCLMPVSPYCPTCRLAMQFLVPSWESSDRLVPAYCCVCKVERLVPRFVEVRC